MGDQIEYAYLTILRWPEEYSHAERVEALIEATGLDAYTADLRVARGVPAVVHRVEASRAREALAPLARRKVVAAAPTQSLMSAVPEVNLAKSLVIPEGTPELMFMAECWRTESVGFRARDVFLLVRARLRHIERRPVKVESTRKFRAGIGMGGVAGYYAPVETTVYHDDKMSLSEIMDIYLRDSRRVRVWGDKFNFDVLGDDRGLTDNQNMDKLALLIAEAEPRILVDTDFEKFTCPSTLINGWRTVKQGGASVRDDHPAFEFYSAWTYLLRRKLAAREK